MTLNQKIILFVLGFVHYHSPAYSQSTEYQFSAGAGLFHYSYTPSSQIFGYSLLTYDPYLPAGPPILYANYPRGNKPGFSWHLSVGQKKINANNFIFDMNLYFESRQSKKDITGVTGYVRWSPDITPATGALSLRNIFWGISPSFGKRFLINKTAIYFDFLLGADLMLVANKRAHLIIDANISKTDAPPNGLLLYKDDKSSESGDEFMDIRINGRMEIGYKNWGMATGYAIGFHNSDKSAINIDYDIKSNTSRYLYTGFFYRLKKKKNNFKPSL